MYLDYHHASMKGPGSTTAQGDTPVPWAHTTQADPNGRLSLSLGVQGFPETLVTDTAHRVVARHKGPILNAATLHKMLSPS